MPALCLQQKAILMSVIILSTVSVNVYVFYVEVAAFSHVLYRTLVNARITVYHYINVRNASDARKTGQATDRVQLMGHGLNIVELASDATAAIFDGARCEESSFAECPLSSRNDFRPQNSSYINRTFHVAFLPRPHWLSKPVLNFSSCKFTNCHFHGSNVTATTDVVIVDADYLTTKQKQPNKHWKHQLYILAVRESAVHTVSRLFMKNNTVWSRLFNMTLSYRQDSEMFVPYKIGFHPKPLDLKPNYYKIANNKTKTAVWFASHCKAHSLRDEYVKEIKKHVDVDIFDQCAKTTFTGSRSPSAGMLTSAYKFYLLLEDPDCRDYITDEMFTLFDPGTYVIPVVRGGADYVKHLPKNVYINAAHFSSARKLAVYLKYLASDLETYSKYLEHKDLYTNGAYDRANTACALCEFLNTNKPEIYGLHSWADFLRCYNANDT